MRVYLFSILIFMMSYGASANSCEEAVLRKYNAEFQAFLQNEFKENSNLDIFKSIGFLGKATSSGYKMALNTKSAYFAKSEHLKSFEISVKKFIKSKARFDSKLSKNDSYLSFYPRNEDLPCLDGSLYVEGSKALCSIDEVHFNDGRIGELKSFLDNVFDKISQLELREVNPNMYSLDKNIEVLINDELMKSNDFNLEVSGGVCDLGKSLKKRFSCTIVGGESMTLRLKVGELSDSLSVSINEGMTYSLREVGGSKNSFEVLKTSLNSPLEILKSSNYDVLSEECSVVNNVIECDSDVLDSYILKVIPEKMEEKILLADIIPTNGFELKVKTDDSAQYKIVSAHVYTKGHENSDELQKVSFLENENCTYISTERKILKCKKMLSPYTVSASYTGINKQEKSVDIGSFEKFSLQVEPDGVNSLSQVDRVVVLGDGSVISPSSYKDLGLSIKIGDQKKHTIEFSEENSTLTSERKRNEYEINLELHHESKMNDSKKVKIKKYVAGENYFFDIIKNNRQCHFELMKFENESNFKPIGQEEYVSNMMEIKVNSRKGRCSRVQKGKESTKIFCTLSKDKLQEEVSVKLMSNGVLVRSVSCTLINENYYEEDEEDDEDRIYSSSGSKSAFSSEMTESLTNAIPTIINSRYQTQQPSFYNPLMYSNYGYSPYSTYTPGYYQSPGLWNTMYMFNPATY